jgi:hypothetical protein
MASWNIGCTWIGDYSYDASDAFPELPPPVGFSLRAKLGWFGRFRGTIHDDERTGVPEPATMVGRVCGSGITFRKLYSRLYANCEGEMVTVVQHLFLSQGGCRTTPEPHLVSWSV